MKNFQLFLLFLTVVMCGACIGCDSPADAPEPAVLMPLAIGNEWIGRRTFHDGQPSAYDTLRILADTLINGERWFIASNEMFYINRADGLYIKRPYDNSPARLEKFPVRMGDTMTDMGEFSLTDEKGAYAGIIHVYREVTATNIRIDVPSGSYTGFRADWRMKVIKQEPNMRPITQSDHSYYVPNIGQVKYEGYIKPGTDAVETWELISATIHD